MLKTRDVAVAATLGVSLIVAGVAFVYWPAALIVAGGLLLTIGILAETT